MPTSKKPRPRLSSVPRPPPSGHTEGLRATLREAREQLGLRQEDVAKMLEAYGVSVGSTAISMWETLKRNPDLAEMSAWARCVGLRLVVELEPADSERSAVMVQPDRTELAKAIDLLSPAKVSAVERVIDRLAGMTPGQIERLAAYLEGEE